MELLIRNVLQGSNGFRRGLFNVVEWALQLSFVGAHFISVSMIIFKRRTARPGRQGLAYNNLDDDELLSSFFKLVIRSIITALASNERSH